jgi:hypothetical protein
MKWLIVLIFIISSPVYAGDVPKTGSYNQTVVVQVNSSGLDLQEAKQNGFRIAIQQVVGSVLISKQSVSSTELTEDMIDEYSAGYIDDYKVLSSTQRDGEWNIVMKVKVASSKMALRMLSSREGGEQLDGERIYTAINSQLHTNTSSDFLMTNIMSSWPKEAFIHEIGQASVYVNNRSPTIDIPYTLKYNQRWLAALNEALSTVAVDADKCSMFRKAVTVAVGTIDEVMNKICGHSPDVKIRYEKAVGDMVYSTSTYMMPNATSLEPINNKLMQEKSEQLGVVVNFYSADNTLITAQCQLIPLNYFVEFDESAAGSRVDWNPNHRRPYFIGQAVLHGNLRINLNTINIKDVRKITLNIQTQCNSID